MKTKLGMPYMGCKRKISGKIISKILTDYPKTKYFYDLFGGGGAVSFMAIQYPNIKKVVYNELNIGVVELLKNIVKNGVSDKYYNWMDRKTFNKNKDKDDWFGGLCKVIWSFGNNQVNYLFGKDVEYNKFLAHKIVVDKDKKAMEELSKIFKIEIPLSIIEDNLLLPKTLTQRRLEFCRFMKIKKDERKGLEQLQQLEQLQRLEQLQQLEQLEQLEIQNKSYEDIVITTPVNETIIYLDPPYKGTAEYQKKLNHEKLYKWVKNNKYIVYVSSYEYDLPCVLEIEHTSSLSATSNNKTIERLFLKK